MTVRETLITSAIAVAAIVPSYFFLDEAVAVLCARLLQVTGMNGRASTLPSLLFQLSGLVTVVSWIVYIALTGGRVKGRHRLLCLHLGLSVPFAYWLKSILKYSFGRPDPRLWLIYPATSGFHWFHGGGAFDAFPSGHMSVFSAIILAVSRHYPECSRACFAFLGLLALSLVVTNHHYLSDIPAGLIVGMAADRFALVFVNAVRRGQRS